MTEQTIVHDAIRDEAIYTPHEIARLTKCSASTVRRAIKTKRLRARRNGERLLIIRGADANQWVNSFASTDLENTEDDGVSSGMKTRNADDSAFLSVVQGQK
jgi:excisionase family DNA binding protein